MGTASRLERKEQIARLLSAGLDHYGDDAIGKAIQIWRQVLELDPGNPEALDYIQTADRRDQRRLPPEEQLSDTHRRLVHEACGCIESEDWEGALDLLRSPADDEGTVLEYEATVEIVRSRLLRKYSQRVGERDGVPCLREAGGDITAFNLPSDAGFMLSLIDGTTAIEDLISLSGMDAFEALRLLGGLLDADIVEMRA
jgi:hypothetical protein